MKQALMKQPKIALVSPAETLMDRYASMYSARQGGDLTMKVNEAIKSLSVADQLTVILAYKQSSWELTGTRSIDALKVQRIQQAKDAKVPEANVTLARQLKLIDEFKLVVQKVRDDERFKTIPISWANVVRSEPIAGFISECGALAVSVMRMSGPFANSRVLAAGNDVSTYFGFMKGRYDMTIQALKETQKAELYMALDPSTPLPKEHTPETLLMSALVLNPLNLLDCADYRRGGADQAKLIAGPLNDAVHACGLIAGMQVPAYPKTPEGIAPYLAAVRVIHRAARTKLTERRARLTGRQQGNAVRTVVLF